MGWDGTIRCGTVLRTEGKSECLLHRVYLYREREREREKERECLMVYIGKLDLLIIV